MKGRTQKSKSNKFHSSVSWIGPLAAGFSFMELIIVIGILGLIAGASLMGVRATKQRTVLEEAQASILNALGEARSQATTGVGTTHHGLHIEGNKIISFEGAVYTPGIGTEEELPDSISINTTDNTIIFSRLTGQANTGALITVLSQSGDSLTITVTEEGNIIQQ